MSAVSHQTVTGEKPQLSPGEYVHLVVMLMLISTWLVVIVAHDI